MRKNQGITLIALVITIIVLLILAGVSISMLVGESGIITKATEAKTQTEIGNIKENIQTDILSKQMESKGNILEKDLISILKKYGTVEYEEDRGTVKGITTKDGNEILLADMFKGELELEGSPNEPDISGFNKENTYYVSWDLTSSPYQIKENTNLKGTEPEDWYDYTEGVNKWANVKTTGGKNDCYWVWIPRYAYQVPDRESGGETINIKFLKGTTNKPIDGSSITISNDTVEGHWNVAPAFWWDKNNNGEEEDGEQLTGIWVAKFEASSDSPSVVENPQPDQLAIDGGSEADTDLKVRVKPNVTSWRMITSGNIFKVCQALTTSGNSLENSTNLDAHMMKNVEWGAVAYLSRSVYGMNSKVWNNSYGGASKLPSITGLCAKETQDQDLLTDDINTTFKYNEKGGENASTTGNVYGIYDMSGGTWELVAGILSSKKSNNPYYDFTNIETKYYDSYESYSDLKYGDAVYETSFSVDDNNNSWDYDYSMFLNADNPVFGRGGRALDGSKAGIFAFICNHGKGQTFYGFRPCIISLQ